MSKVIPNSKTAHAICCINKEGPKYMLKNIAQNVFYIHNLFVLLGISMKRSKKIPTTPEIKNSLIPL